MEAFDTSGQWWLADDPKNKVVGLISYSASDGFRLEIPYGTLGDMTNFAERVNDPARASLIHGQMRNGKAITLIDAAMTGAKVSVPGTMREEYRAFKGFVGAVYSVANPLIDRVRIDYSHLRDWVVRHPGSSRHSTAGDQIRATVDYHYETPKDLEIANGDRWRLVLSHVAEHSYPSILGFNLSHDCLLTLELSKPTDFDTVETRFLGPIWQFLSFCLDRRIDTTSLSIKLAGEEEWLDVGRSQLITSDKDNIIMQPFMLLSMPRLGDRLSDVVCRWLGFDGDEHRAVSLLVGLLSERTIPSDLRFLAAVQAVEAISRVGESLHELDDDEFQRRRNAVSEAISDRKVREWAERKLQYANDRAFRELLRDLVSDIGEYVDSLAPDLDRFLSDVLDNRNFYTHRDDTRARRPLLKGGELYVLTQGLIILLKAAVLRKLDFSQEETKSLLTDCQGVIQWRRRVAEQYKRPE
jgi:hypothetical protein